MKWREFTGRGFLVVVVVVFKTFYSPEKLSGIVFTTGGLQWRSGCRCKEAGLREGKGVT